MATEEIKLTFKTKQIREDLKLFIINCIKEFESETLPQKSLVFKNKLDNQFGKGWNVWLGKHLTGACSCITNTMLEFTDGNIYYVIYQTYVP